MNAKGSGIGIFIQAVDGEGIHVASVTGNGMNINAGGKGVVISAAAGNAALELDGGDVGLNIIGKDTNYNPVKMNAKGSGIGIFIQAVDGDGIFIDSVTGSGMNINGASAGARFVSSGGPGLKALGGGTSADIEAKELPVTIKRNVAIPGYKYVMVSSTTGNPVAGLIVLAQRKLDADVAWSNMTGAKVDNGFGAYSIDINAVDTDGLTGIWKFTAPGGETTFVTIITEG